MVITRVESDMAGQHRHLVAHPTCAGVTLIPISGFYIGPDPPRHLVSCCCPAIEDTLQP
jgi:hypothetical protein